MKKKNSSKESKSKKENNKAGKIETKKWLLKNEIWFTTITSLALSIMALYLTYSEYSLSKRQTAIEYANNHPDFQIHKSLLSSQENEIIDDLEIIVQNKNKGVVRNLNISSKVFLNMSIGQFEYDDIYEKREPELKRFFLVDQFESVDSDENKSRIKSPSFRHQTFVNDSIYFATQEQRIQLFQYMLNQELQKSNLTILEFRREIIIKLSYLNFLNKKNIEYYRLFLDPIKEESTIAFGKNINAEFIESEQEARKIFDNKEKLNYISFVYINNFEDFFRKINEEKYYSYDEINSVKFRLGEMDSIMLQKVKKGNINLDTIKIENPLEKLRRKFFNELLNEMKNNLTVHIKDYNSLRRIS